MEKAMPMMKGKGEIKRGRLRNITMKNMYGSDGNLSGHTVTADHEPDGDEGGYPPPIETPHESFDSAAAQMHQHHMANMKRFGGKGKKPMMDDGPMKAAMARRKR